MARRKRNGVNKDDVNRIKRKFPSLGTALNRKLKKALRLQGDWWFGKMADRFRAPLVPYGQVNNNRTLHNRTNALRNSLHKRVEGSKLKELRLRMWGDSEYAPLQEYGGVIKPRRANGYLAIPIDDNLTAAGAVRWDSPTHPEIVDGFFLASGKNRDSLYYVRRTVEVSRKKKNKYQEIQDLKFLFALRKRVEIPGPKAPSRKMPSRLGMIDTATNQEARGKLRRRLAVATASALKESFDGGAR